MFIGNAILIDLIYHFALAADFTGSYGYFEASAKR